MRALIDVRPTPEQLAIVSRNRPGTEIIRGAAGSGKTTTALLRLRSLIGMFVNRKKRQQREDPIRILVLTFNRTLRGYIEALARQQFSETGEINIEISTFSRWALTVLSEPSLLQDSNRKTKIITLGAYGSPIFKAVPKKRCKALYRALKKSPKSPELAVGAGSEPSYVDRSVGAP